MAIDCKIPRRKPLSKEMKISEIFFSLTVFDFFKTIGTILIIILIEKGINTQNITVALIINTISIL